MAHPRRFRFGVQLHRAPDGRGWAERARRVEDQGFTTLFLPDHFGEQFAPLPAMAAAAAATTTLRVGCLVHGLDYKHPVVLAKEIATLDVLSDGRVEVGLGAGWLTDDYEQAGITKDSNKVRVDRFEEAVAVVKGLFGDGPLTFAGTHFTIKGLDGTPKPVQRPHPPLLIGGGGPRMLSIAAREADIVGVNPSLHEGAMGPGAVNDALASRVTEKVALLREAAGDRFEDLELNVLVFLGIVTDDRRGLAEAMAPSFGIDPDLVMDVPYAWFGSVEEICDQIRAARERWGISYWVIQGDAADAMAPVVAQLAGT